MPREFGGKPRDDEMGPCKDPTKGQVAEPCIQPVMPDIRVASSILSRKSPQFWPLKPAFIRHVLYTRSFTVGDPKSRFLNLVVEEDVVGHAEPAGTEILIERKLARDSRREGHVGSDQRRRSNPGRRRLCKQQTETMTQPGLDELGRQHDPPRDSVRSTAVDRVSHPRQPSWTRSDIVVDEHEDVAAAMPDGRVASATQPWVRLNDVTDAVISRMSVRNHGGSLIPRAIVDHDQLELDIVWNFCKHSGEGRPKVIGTISRADANRCRRSHAAELA
jgi:hypothetical protein